MGVYKVHKAQLMTRTRSHRVRMKQRVILFVSTTDKNYLILSTTLLQFGKALVRRRLM